MKTLVIFLVSFSLISFLVFGQTKSKSDKNSSDGQRPHEGKHNFIHVVQIRWNVVHYPLIITSFMLAIILVTVAFHRIKILANNVPESSMLIALGLLIGIAFLADPEDHKLLELKSDGHVFYFFLLPPIILEAAYSLRDRAFVEHFGTIILYAVVGTILNIILIGFLLYAFNQSGIMGFLELGILDCLIFSSLIAAVDPVAVLAIFQEIGVNDMLYYMVFGESLFNDAVTIVVYNLVVQFKSIPVITPALIGQGFGAFIVVSAGAMAVGCLCGFLAAFVTKYTEKSRIVEPGVLFGLAYMSYLLAELFHFSGIIRSFSSLACGLLLLFSIICCGLIQAHYAMENISSKSYITVHCISKAVSGITESLIFIILGVMLMNKREVWNSWNTSFAFTVILLCIIVRFAVVFLLTFCVNLYTIGIRRISYEEQLILSYGGLRGAIAFSLVFMLDKNEVTAKDTLLTATFVIILFTTVLQGLTIKPLVHMLRIQLRKKDVSMTKEVTRGLIENTMTGIESIMGSRGSHYWVGMFGYISHKFLRPLLQREAHRKGKGLVAIQHSLALRQNMDNANGFIGLVEGSAVWNQLDRIDVSDMPSSFGDVLLEMQDRHKEKSRKQQKQSLRLTTMSDIIHPRDQFMAPPQKTIHYRKSISKFEDDHIDRESAAIGSFYARTTSCPATVIFQQRPSFSHHLQEISLDEESAETSFTNTHSVIVNN